MRDLADRIIRHCARVAVMASPDIISRETEFIEVMMSRSAIGRRTFLQGVGAAASAILLGQTARALAESMTLPPQQGGVVNPEDIDFDNELNSYNELYGNPPLLGRIWVWNRVPLCKEPSPNAGRVKNVFGGQGVHGSYIAPIYRAV